MKTEDRSGTEERTILMGMLTNRHICARMAQGWCSEGLFRSRYANLLAGWAVHHFNKYGDAIGPRIEDRLERYAATTTDKDTLNLVESLVAGLSMDWQGTEVNGEYVLDLAQQFTMGVTVERGMEQATAMIKRGEVAEAVALLNKLSPPMVTSQQWIDPFLDREAIRNAFEQAAEPLITFGGALGELYKNVFCRDSLIAFRAIAKAGKSFNLLELVYRAVKQGRKVAYFCIGDMSEAQVLHRIGQRVTRQPMYAGTYAVPVGWDDESAEPFPVSEDRAFPHDLTWEESADAGARFIGKLGGEEGTRCRLSVHASRSLNVYGFRALLQSWALGGWVPDVIVVDYADLFGRLPDYPSKWESVAETWQELRAISQTFHCCIIVATQSGVDGYGKDVLGMEDFTGSREQNDAVNAMYSLTQTEEEAALGIQRIKPIANRNNPDTRVVAVLGCRALACPVMYSRFCTGVLAKSAEKPKRKTLR